MKDAELKKVDSRLIAMFDSRGERERLEYFVTLNEVSEATRQELFAIEGLMVTYWTGSETVGKTIICLSEKQTLKALNDCRCVLRVEAPSQYAPTVD
jgi:hypothetical protein